MACPEIYRDFAIKMGAASIVVVVGLSFPISVFSQTCTTTQSGNWSSASTWSCTGGAANPPIGAFANGTTVNINHNVTIANPPAAVVNLEYVKYSKCECGSKYHADVRSKCSTQVAGSNKTFAWVRRFNRRFKQ